MQVAILSIMEKIEVTFGRVVRSHRESSGVSQEAFADIAGVHRTYISSIELGKVSISIAVAQQLADALEVKLSRLFRDVEKLQESN